jgi:hypothetical protein
MGNCCKKNWKVNLPAQSRIWTNKRINEMLLSSSFT